MLEVGDLVLYKWARTRKSMPLWDPVMYEVVARKGSMVTAARQGQTVTRNSSFFKFWSAGEQTDRPASEQEVKHEVEQVENRAAEQVASQGAEQMLKEKASVCEVPMDQLVNATPAEEVAAQGQFVGLERRGKVGRPTKSEQAVRDASKSEAAKTKALSNPPLRKSPRNLS